MAVLAVIVAVGAWALVGSEQDCADEPLRLRVAAAPAIAPAIAETAEVFTDAQLSVGSRCVEVGVETRAPAAVMAGLADGDAAAEPPPDAWVPDSTLWIEQARRSEPAALQLTSSGHSIATSPVVMAMHQPVAEALGWPSKPVSWGALVPKTLGGGGVPAYIADPRSEATGLIGLLAAGALLERQANADLVRAALIRDFAQRVRPEADDLYAALEAGEASQGALVTSEQSVWTHNAAKAPVPVVAVYPSEGTLDLDYPYIVVGTAEMDLNRKAAAERFLTWLRADEGRAAVQSRGFRGPDGELGTGKPEERGLAQPAPKTLPATADRKAAQRALQAWTTFNQSTRMLTLLDVSGSMGEQVPGTGKTRMELTISAAQQGLGLFRDDSEIGLWVFAARLSSSRDYREVVSLGALGDPVGEHTRREVLAGALASTRPVVGGATGLYDTILAAYRTAKAGYDPDRVNSVLVFTDGANADPESITLEELLAALKDEADPKQPIPVISIAFGPEADPAAMQAIAEATSGASYTPEDPTEIQRVFLDAVSQRGCRPNC